MNYLDLRFALHKSRISSLGINRREASAWVISVHRCYEFQIAGSINCCPSRLDCNSGSQSKHSIKFNGALSSMERRRPLSKHSPIQLLWFQELSIAIKFLFMGPYDQQSTSEPTTSLILSFYEKVESKGNNKLRMRVLGHNLFSFANFEESRRVLSSTKAEMRKRRSLWFTNCREVFRPHEEEMKAVVVGALITHS